MSIYICRDFGDISKWLPPSRIYTKESERARVHRDVDKQEISIPRGVNMDITLKSLKDSFLEIDSALTGKCTIYNSSDNMFKCPLSNEDMAILNELKLSKNIVTLICLKLMQAVYVNEAGSQGNLPDYGNYVETGNGVIITKSDSLKKAQGLLNNGLYFYALYTAPFGKAYAVNPDVLKSEIGALERVTSTKEAINLAQKSNKHILLQLTNVTEVQTLASLCPDILSAHKTKLTDNRNYIYGYSSLQWMTFFYTRELKNFSEAAFNSYIQRHSADSSKMLFALYFLLDAVYNLPTSKEYILSANFNEDSLEFLSNKFVIPNRKPNEKQTDYDNRCMQAVNSWVAKLNDKPGFKTVIEKSADKKRWTFIQNLSSRYATLIRRIKNG